MKFKLKYEYINARKEDYSYQKLAANLDALALDNINITPFTNTYPIHGWLFVYANSESQSQCIGKVDLTMKAVKINNELHKYLHLSSVYVIPAFQEKKIGSGLLNYCDSIAKNNNCEMISVLSTADITLDQLKSLQKVGYDIHNNKIIPIIKSLTNELQNKMIAYRIANAIVNNPLPHFYTKNNFLMLRTPFDESKVKNASLKTSRLYLKPLTQNTNLFNSMVSTAFLAGNTTPEFKTTPVDCSKPISDAMEIY